MISASEKNKPKTPVSGTKVRKPALAAGKSGLANKGMNGEQKTGNQAQTQPPHRYQAQRNSSKEPWGLYMMVTGACVLLILSYALYMSSASSKGWTPVPETEGSFEPTTVSTTQTPVEPDPEPEVVEPPATINIVSPTKEIVQQSIRPNATVDVPNLRLRKMPDITGKVTLGDLKRGERVEIVKKFAGSGPEWVKIKTRSGRTGWVFASSLVKEGKRK